MVERKSLIWWRLVFVSSIITCLLSFPSDQEAKQLKAGPLDFSLKTLEGREVSLKDYRGKKMVHLMFWATWCRYCLIEMPKLKKLYQAIGNRPYEILAVNVYLNDSLRRVRDTQERYQMPFKILLDEKGEAAKKCGITGVPLHIIIDKEGVIKDRFYNISDDPTKYFNQLFSH